MGHSSQKLGSQQTFDEYWKNGKHLHNWSHLESLREKQNKSSNEPDVILVLGVRQRLELLRHKTTVETISPGQKHTGNKKFELRLCH